MAFFVEKGFHFSKRDGIPFLNGEIKQQIFYTF